MLSKKIQQNQVSIEFLNYPLLTHIVAHNSQNEQPLAQEDHHESITDSHVHDDLEGERFYWETDETTESLPEVEVLQTESPSFDNNELIYATQDENEESERGDIMYDDPVHPSSSDGVESSTEETISRTQDEYPSNDGIFEENIHYSEEEERRLEEAKRIVEQLAAIERQSEAPHFISDDIKSTENPNNNEPTPFFECPLDQDCDDAFKQKNQQESNLEEVNKDNFG